MFKIDIDPSRAMPSHVREGTPVSDISDRDLPCPLDSKRTKDNPIEPTAQISLDPIALKREKEL